MAHQWLQDQIQTPDSHVCWWSGICKSLQTWFFWLMKFYHPSMLKYLRIFENAMLDFLCRMYYLSHPDSAGKFLLTIQNVTQMSYPPRSFPDLTVPLLQSSISILAGMPVLWVPCTRIFNRELVTLCCNYMNSSYFISYLSCKTFRA